MNETTLSRADGQPEANGVSTTPVAPPGYELREEVGRGGMGVVYRARDVTLEREVAVKILKNKFAPDSATAARFLEEARITGQLQHPGIPAVYQVGALADGRPFLAMKLIKGQTLDVLLKEGGAESHSSFDGLAVFEAVAQAVGYAHAHGVIHRDLKPANVMVGAFGEVQVMDWGLAKVLTSGSTPTPQGGPDSALETTTAPTEIRPGRDFDTPFTQYGSILGTPAYMPPEQAAGEVHKVDTRADVFGLGAILCVLLTGKPPFEGKDSESVRLNAVRGKTEEALARLDACGADPDVVGLCKRCLAFEPAERPATADGVATAVAALRRQADERAKQAEADKLAAEVRAAEQAKRRRAVQWAYGVVAAVLLLGVVGTSLGLIRAETARRAEADERKKAEAKEAEANAVVKFFEDKVFAAARPKGVEGGLGQDLPLRDAIAASLPALAKGFADQPLVEARLRTTLGSTFFYLGEALVAAEQFERTRALHTQQLGSDHPDTLGSMNSLANCYHALGRYADAVRLHEETLSIRRRVLGRDHPDTLRSMNNLASSYHALARHADALVLHEETLDAHRRVLGPDHPDTLKSMNNLANGYVAVRRHDDALRLREETLVACKRVMGPDHPDTLMGMHNLANSYAALGRHPDALELREEAVAAYQRVLGPDHPDTLKSMNNLANSFQVLGRHDDAHQLRAQTQAAFKRVLGPDHPDTLTSQWRLAESLVKLERGAEAIPFVDECLARAAGKMVDPRMLLAVINLRLRHFQNANNLSGCRTTAETWEKLNRADVDSLLAAARIRAIAAAVQARTPGTDAAQLAQEDGRRAVAWLARACTAGFKDRTLLAKDKDLDFLRDQDDFRKLLASLPETVPAR